MSTIGTVNNGKGEDKLKTNATKNYIYNTLYKVLTMLTPLITAPFLARVIGKDNVGIYSFTFSIAYNFSLVAKLGLINYGSRAIAKVRDDKIKRSETFSQIFYLQIVTTVIATLAYYIFVLFFAKEYKTILLINGIYVFSISFDIDWLFYGLEDFKTVSLRNTFVKLVTVVSILAFVRKENGLMTYVIIMILSDILRFASMWLKFGKATYLSKASVNAVFSHFKPTLVLFIPVIATSIYRSMDKIMLGALSDMGETGLYEYSEKIVYMLLGFVTSLEVVMMPRISNMLEKGEKDSAFKSIQQSMTFVVALTCAMAFGISGITNRFIPLFYGEEFDGCRALLPPLAITLIFIGWANVIRTQYIMPKGKDKIYVISTVIGAVVNLIANFIFIPMFNAMGAVIGTMAAELSVAIYLTVIVSKKLPIRSYLKNTFAFPIIGVLMWFSVDQIGKHIDNIYISLFVQIVFGGVFFIALSMLFIYFSQPELFDAFKKTVTKIIRRISK